MASDFVVIVTEDGTVLVPRGTKTTNDAVRKILHDFKRDNAETEAFFKVTDDVELIFGETTYCG